MGAMMLELGAWGVVLACIAVSLDAGIGAFLLGWSRGHSACEGRREERIGLSTMVSIGHGLMVVVGWGLVDKGGYGSTDLLLILVVLMFIVMGVEVTWAFGGGRSRDMEKRGRRAFTRLIALVLSVDAVLVGAMASMVGVGLWWAVACVMVTGLIVAWGSYAAGYSIGHRWSACHEVGG